LLCLLYYILLRIYAHLFQRFKEIREKKRVQKIFGRSLGSYCTQPESSVRNKSRVAIRIASDRLGYIPSCTSLSMPARYASGKWTVISFIVQTFCRSLPIKRCALYKMPFAFDLNADNIPIFLVTPTFEKPNIFVENLIYMTAKIQKSIKGVRFYEKM